MFTLRLRRSALSKALSLSLPQQVVNAMAGGVSDAEGINYYLDAIKNFNAMDVKIETADIVPGLLQALKPKIKAPMCLRVLGALEQASKEKKACETIMQNDGIRTILAVLGTSLTSTNFEIVNRTSETASPEATAHGLTTIKNVVEMCGSACKIDLDTIISILDNHRSHVGIQKAGSALIAATINPNDLGRCLQILESSTPDSPERAQALTLLSSMSYMSGCADQISKQGGIPLIVNALTQALKCVNNKLDPKIAKSVNGTCKMLGAIAAKSSEERKKIVSAKGLEALILAVQTCPPDVYTEGYTAALSALAKLCVEPTCHDQLSTCCSKIVDNMSVSNYVLPATAELLNSAGTCSGFLSAKAPMSIAKYAAALPNNGDYQENMIQAAAKMIHGSWDDSGKMIMAVGKLVSTSEPREQIAIACQPFFTRATDYSHSVKNADWSTTVEAALTILLNFSDSNVSIAKSALNCLEALATERDVTRTLNDLEGAVNSAASNPARCLKCLAAVNGLSQLSRLRPAFETNNAGGIIAKGLKSWVEASKFNDQKRIIKYGCQCIDSLLGEKPVDATLAPILETMLLPSMKALRDRQDDPIDNSLNEMARVVEVLCRTQRFSSPAFVNQVIENLVKCIRKYPESRGAQVSLINALNSVANIGPDAAHALIDSGALKTVLTYMSKVGMYQGVQLSGCKLLLTIAKTDDRCLQQLKGTDALQVIQSARTTHKSNNELNMYTLQLLSLLIPESEIERLVLDNCRELSKAANMGNFKTVIMCMGNINAAVISPEGAKIAARCDLAKYIAEAQDLAKSIDNSEDHVAVTHELAVGLGAVTQAAMGVNNALKFNGVSRLCDMWESMKGQSKEGTTAVLKGAARMIHKDKSQGKVLFTKGMIPKICVWADNHDDDPEAVIATANLLASLAPQKEMLKYEEYRRWLANLCKKLNEDGPAELKMPLLEALENILLVGDDGVLDIFLRNKGLKGVYKTMDDYPSDWPLIRRCNRVLETVNRQKNLRTCLQKDNETPLVAVGRVVKKILKAPKPEPEMLAATLRNYNAILQSSDTDVFDEVDLLPEIEKMMTDYAYNELVLKACGDYLGKVGSDKMIDNLFRQICDQCNNKPANWTKNLAKLNNQLAVFLVADVKNPDKAFQSCNEAIDLMADVIRQGQKLPDKQTVFPAIAKVVKRLAKRSVEDPSTPYGIPSLKNKMMPALAELLSPASDSPDPKQQLHRMTLIDAYDTMADCARFEPIHSDVVNTCKQYGTIEHALKLLDVYKDDPEVISAILNFLAGLSAQAPGCEALSNVKNKRIGDPDFAHDIIGMMKRFNKNKPLVNAALELLGNLGKNQKQVPPFVTDSGVMKELNEMAKEPELMPGIALMHKKLVGKETRENTVASIKLLNSTYRAMELDANLADALKTEAATALAELIAYAHETGILRPEDKHAGGIKDIISMFEQRKDDFVALQKLTRAVRTGMCNDAEVSAKLAHGGIAEMLNEGGVVLASDPLACYEMLSLMKEVACVEGQARALGTDKSLIAFLNNCYDGRNFATEGLAAPDLKGMVEQIRRMIQDDQPEVLTLEKVYNKWKGKEGQGEALLVSENPIVMQHMSFVHDYTEEYGKEPLPDIVNGLGLEFYYGCLCYKLLYTLESNCHPLNEMNTCKLLLSSAARQRNDFAAQCAIQASNDAVQYASNAEVWAMTDNTALIVAELLSRGRNIKCPSNEERETMINERLQLAERVAMNRTYFNNTECMSALIGLWDDFDKGKYSVELLKQVFKTMRKIINDHWVGLLLKNNVPQRLIEVINDKQARLDLLPDVLFLLAAVAVVPEIKTMIGDLKGVEACLDLLVRSMKNPDRAATSPVLTNDCLALSAITMGHGANLQRFIQSKGVELNIQAMGQTQGNGKLDYDVANAASLLMCNTCFKRDEMKAMYGKQKACECVMRTINQYDGAEDQKAFRCLSTMFKAIGNLALYTPNVEIFMAGKIHQTFAHLYQKSDRLPDSLVEASLRTLSNLAMENTEANMISFGITLPPILYMLTQLQRCSIKMFTLAFDVLGCLCRHADNAKKFLQENGIPICLRILNSYSDAYLYANGIHVLGIQTTNPASVGELVKDGVFNFLTSVLENQIAADDPNVDLTVSACRCIRRLLINQQYGQCFIEVGGLQQIIVLMKTLATEHSMAHLECHRTIINLICLFPPPKPKPADKMTDEWDETVADEGVLPAVETLTRPSGPRSWEQIELDAPQVQDIIVSCVKVLDREEALKQNRLVRSAIGLLAYFACEKIPGVVSTYYDANVTALLTRIFSQQDADSEVIKSGCYILNNVAYASEPEQYVQLRRDREMRKQLDVVSQQMAQHRSFCDMTLRLLNEKSVDPSRFEIHNQWEYPLEYTQWDKDKYPNGVQDLPAEWKEELRAGGKWKTVVNEKDKEILHWKSSMDLGSFQWRIDPREGPFKQSIAVSRICSLTRGLRSETLRLAHERSSPTSKPRENECVVLRGLPCEEFPEGVELNFLCGTKRSRDRFYELLTEWREAAAFGF